MPIKEFDTNNGVKLTARKVVSSDKDGADESAETILHIEGEVSIEDRKWRHSFDLIIEEEAADSFVLGMRQISNHLEAYDGPGTGVVDYFFSPTKGVEAGVRLGEGKNISYASFQSGNFKLRATFDKFSEFAAFCRTLKELA